MHQARNALCQRQTAQEEISCNEEIAAARQRTSTALVTLQRQETRTTSNYFARFAHGANEDKTGEDNEAMDEETTEEVQQQPPQPPHQPNQQQQNVNVPSRPTFDGQFKDLRCLHTAIDICFFQAQSNKRDI
eukprot:4971139-Ditylum_brightwellii.AAC.1